MPVILVCLAFCAAAAFNFSSAHATATPAWTPSRQAPSNGVLFADVPVHAAPGSEAPAIPKPQLDARALEALRFTDFHFAAAASLPGRAALPIPAHRAHVVPAPPHFRAGF
jgi:hypothetical protein